MAVYFSNYFVPRTGRFLGRPFRSDDVWGPNHEGRNAHSEGGSTGAGVVVEVPIPPPLIDHDALDLLSFDDGLLGTENLVGCGLDAVHLEPVLEVLDVDVLVHHDR